jgi:DNA mismatch repair protein MutS
MTNEYINIVDEYLNYQLLYQQKYGENTIVLMQVGSFHEAYQTLTQGYNLHKLADILNIVVSKKNKTIKTIDIKNPYMMGFPSISLPKFLKILIDNSFTVIVIDQFINANKITRKVSGIYSPGVYIEEINNPDSNYLISIYIEEIINEYNKVKNSIYLSGISIIDITTGKTYVYESYSQQNDEVIVLDDIAKIIQSYPSKEFIITTNNLNILTPEKLILYLELTDKLYHHQTISKLITNKGYKNIPKINYQIEIFKKVYGEYPNIIEELNLEKLTYARISLVIILNYINEHNQNFLKNLNMPIIIEKQDYMYIGNNAYYQLNIFNYDIKNYSNIFSYNTQYKSLFDVINKTSTAMGRRFLQHNLINPLLDINKINKRYNIIKYLINNNKWIEFETILKEIPDIERYIRKLSIYNINPIDLNNCINGIKNIYNCVKIEIDDIIDYSRINLIKDMDLMISDFDKIFNYDELSKYLINDITGSIFNKNIYPEIDKLINDIKISENFIYILCNIFNNILNKQIPKKKQKILDNDSDHDEKLIKIDYNDRDGHYLILTKRRAEVLKNFLKDNHINIGNTKIEYQNIEFKSLLKSNNCKLFILEVQKKSDIIIDLKNELKQNIKSKYIQKLEEIYNNYNKILTNIILYISNIDFYKSGAKLAIQNKYNEPLIVNKYNNSSYIDAENLRHSICEKLLIDTEYIPISIKLGLPNHKGVLLFGLNSVGKSTLQKSIGINIILAQIGYYVAATKFEYYPYNTLLTRITSNDNLFKGLSSFTLELSELRAILKRSNQNTLVIADEICKGTEHQSSLIIVMTILEILSQNKSSFITATHLHDLTSFDRLKKLINIKLYHLHVDYDEQNNILKYNRRLLSGSGENFYGLNVAKYLINDTNFFSISNEIKKEIYPQILVNDQTSKYNSKLWVNECQICQYKPIRNTDKPLETHHINFQKNANKDGFLIDKPHLHKNHKSNLCVLCDKCHDLIDKNKLIIYGYENIIIGRKLKYIKY